MSYSDHGRVFELVLNQVLYLLLCYHVYISRGFIQNDDSTFLNKKMSDFKDTYSENGSAYAD